MAIVFNETERAGFLHCIQQSRRVLVSTPTLREMRMVVHGRCGEPAVLLLDDLLRLPLFDPVAPDQCDLDPAYAFVT